MNRHNFIGMSILVSVLALNPLVATEFQNKIETRLNSSANVSDSIASVLHKRGLDEEAAKEIADSLVDGNEELLAQMVANLTLAVPHDEIIEHLGNMALHRKETRLDSYDHLVNMVSKIRKRPLDKNTLNHLHAIARLNSQLVG